MPNVYNEPSRLKRLICPVCTTIYYEPYLRRGIWRKYCSTECQKAAAKARRQERMDKKKLL